MRPLPAPFDALATGGPVPIGCAGSDLLGNRLLTKEMAFSREERQVFALEGLLPDRVLSIEQQVELEVEHLRRKDDDLERYIGLAALQDRNATLFYRVLAENLQEFMPIVYTPVVGRACQEFSHIIRRTRGIWITPADRDRIADVLRSAPYRDVRLIVVTDNERILGLGDLGAGGMGIPIGKLALYTAACGIHPSVTLPVSLDVGTDNPVLLDDPLYLGYRAARLRGAAYDELVEAFVEAVMEVWPGCVIQWEDFKHGNALRILDRYRDRVCSFNDDVQGTSAVVVGGVLSAFRDRPAELAAARFVLAGAGAAGTGIARLLKRALIDAGLSEGQVARALVMVDSHGLVHAGRTDLDPIKRTLALPTEVARADGFDLSGEVPPDLLATVTAVRPTVLVGTTAVAGTFTEPIIRQMASTAKRPIILPLSNPTTSVEATPSDILDWTEGRAIVATGSPFTPVTVGKTQREIGQANNVFVFPGIGLGTIVAEASSISDGMILAAARALAASVSAERIAAGALYPRIADLRSVSRRVAVAVVSEAISSGLSGLDPDMDVEALVDRSMWWPAYVSYLPAHELDWRAEAARHAAAAVRAGTGDRSADPAVDEVATPV